MAEGPNSLDSEAAVRPDRAKATICRLNSGVYRTVLSAIVNSSCYNGEVSTEPGQLHIVLRTVNEAAYLSLRRALIKGVEDFSPDIYVDDEGWWVSGLASI
jgi:hypothetical protein